MEVNGIPCRKVFSDVILEEACRNKDIFVVTSDSRGSAKLEEFAEKLPGQFIEVGIAEQNAVGIGAGLALCSKNVFVCGPACFYTSRALDQIRIDVAYTGTNVKIIGISGGVSYGALGTSHHSLHDIAVMRTFPGMKVYLPADRYQTEKLTRYLAQTTESAYVRLGRDAVPDVYTSGDPFVPGKANILAEGNDIAIIATGETVFHALGAHNLLKEKGINARVIDMHTLKPLDTDIIIRAASETRHIITVEEHSIYGGLGASVAEVVAQNSPVKMRIIGIPDENVIHARPAEIFKHYGLTSDNIVNEARRLLQ